VQQALNHVRVASGAGFAPLGQFHQGGAVKKRILFIIANNPPAVALIVIRRICEGAIK